MCRSEADQEDMNVLPTMRHVLGVVPSRPGLREVKGIRHQGSRPRHGGLVHGAAGQEVGSRKNTSLFRFGGERSRFD
jgi:hypothetical protein